MTAGELCKGLIERQKRADRERALIIERLQQAEKMEAVGGLAGGVARYSNNILSEIVSCPDLLFMQLPKEHPLKKHIEIIKTSGSRASAIVQKLLTLARRGVAVSEVTNMNRIVTEYLESPEYDHLFSLHSAAVVEARLQGDLMNIRGSPLHLIKTSMSLVANAFESMPAGGKILIATENRHLDRPLEGYDDVIDGDYTVLSVKEEGTGIPHSEIHRVFEPLFTRKTMGFSGSGLGLAVVWGTVQDHQGYIDVKSIEGRGTTFFLYFPVTRRKMEPGARPVSMDAYQGAGESVLVVDGPDTCRHILKLYPAQNIIIVIGYSEKERVREALSPGAVCVKKPHTMESVARAAKNILLRKNNPPQ